MKSSLAADVRAVMHGPRSPVTEILIGPGARPLLLPEAVMSKMREEGRPAVDEMDEAVHHFALGLAWARSLAEEPSLSAGRRARKVKRAAELACVDFNGIDPVL